jgi:hypothetical protein
LLAAAGFLVIGIGWTCLSLVVIHAYSGGVTPFGVRYGPSLGAGLAGMAAALKRPEVLDYARTLLLSGGWLGLLAPLSLLPAVPSLALNAFSTSPWMAAGMAHYSGLVLPFIALAVALALARLNQRMRLQYAAAAAVLLTSIVGYLTEGAGPLAANYAPAQLTPHARAAQAIADSLPADAAVSASTSLVPHLTHRAHAYVFPAVQDADYVFLDLQASPAPTSAGDVYLRVQSLLASGDWQVDTDADGLLLLEHAPDAGATLPTDAPSNMPSVDQPSSLRAATGTPRPNVPSIDHPPTLLSAALVPSPDAAIDMDGPRWTLRTTWQTDEPLPAGTHLDFWVDLQTGDRLHIWDVAPLWWNPPDQWPANQPVTVDVPNIPLRSFKSWSATWSTP